MRDPGDTGHGKTHILAKPALVCRGTSCRGIRTTLGVAQYRQETGSLSQGSGRVEKGEPITEKLRSKISRTRDQADLKYRKAGEIETGEMGSARCWKVDVLREGSG